MVSEKSGQAAKKSIYRRIAVILLRTVLIVLLLIVALVFSLQTSFVQNIIRGKAEAYLSQKLKTKVAIGNLYVGFPHDVVLKKIYIEDREKDTLLSGNLLQVDVDMWKLFHGEIDIDRVQLQGITAKVKRLLPDTVFNFQFIVDAFSDSTKKTPEKKDTSSLKIALHNLSLDSIRIIYDDAKTGNDIEARIGHSYVKMDDLNLDKQLYSIPVIQLKNSSIRVTQHEPLLVSQNNSSPPATQSNFLQLALSQIQFENIRFTYTDEPNAMNASIVLGEFNTQVKSFDLAKQTIQLEKIALNKTTASVRLGKKQKQISSTTNSTDTSSGWKISSAKISLADNNIRFDDDTKAKQKYGMDYSHIDAKSFNLDIDNFLFTKDTVAGFVKNGQVREQSGFQLDRLAADFLYTNSQAYLKNIDIKTPGTELKRTLAITYPSLAAVSKDISKLNMDIDLANSKVQLKDVLIFVPQLRNQPAFKNSELTLFINSRITGSMKQLLIKEFQCSGFSGTKIDMSGMIRNATDQKNIYADLAIKNIITTRNDIALFVPRKSLPQNISIPEKINLSGKLKGGTKDAVADLLLNTSSGTVAVKGNIQNATDIRSAIYNAEVQTKKINLGEILKDKETYGLLTSVFTIKGAGLDTKTANATITGNIRSFEYKKYNYQDLKLDGSIADQQARLNASINNPEIQLTLYASADLSKKFPAAKIDLQVDTIDLFALHLLKDTLQAKGNLHADFANTNPDSLEGSLYLTKLLFNNGKKIFSTDSVHLQATQQDGGSDIQLHSEMADIDWKGKYKLTETARSVEQTINNYYRLTKLPDTTLTAQDWELKIKLRASPLVLNFMPSLKNTDTIAAIVNFNSEKNDLHAFLSAPHIQYGANSINKTSLQISTDEKNLNYNLQVGNTVSGGLRLNQVAVYGHLADNKLYTSLLLKDEKNKPQYSFAATLNQVKDGIQLALNADSLLLNYEKWQASNDNFIHYDSSGLIVHDFKIENSNQSFLINSINESPTSPIHIAFTDFKIATLTKFARQDSLPADGVLNGTAEIKNIFTNPVFTSDLTIKNLSYSKDTLGDLLVKVNNEEANAFFADISLKGYKNDLNVSGKYYTGESRMDMKLNIAQLNLRSLKPLTTNILQDIDGLMKGNLAVSGSVNTPQLNGYIYFDSTKITPLVSGEPLKLSNDKIEFDKDGFNFSKFTILDSANNKAIIDGNVYSSDFRNYKFDIYFNANNFRLVNSTQSSNKLFYGKLNMDIAANVSGDMESPKVEGNVRVNKRTDFTVILPSNDPELISREGVVRFIDKDHPIDTVLLINQKLSDSLSRESTIKGIEVAANIETDSNAIFTMIIDERSGDALSVRGRSDLSFGMDKSGKMSLTGNYEVESGTYNLSLDVLKRKFDIQRGSTITWTGDPTSAQLNMVATYSANTASIDLVEQELAGRTQTEINKFKQKLPFLVKLKMEGELLKPQITFDISLPDNVLSQWPDVDTKLQQVRSDQSELNKQVFALLLLNRFVGENPLQSSGDALDAGQMAWQSASQILSNQLNAFASSLIKGVDINFDLNNTQDYSTGEQQNRTDLNVTVSKRLLNDRIRVNVGSNFELQGPANPNENATNIAGDIAVDYQLTKDGRYTVRAYRKNQYELVVEGQVVESGISFILTLDYNKFKEIFGRSRKKRNIKRTSTDSVQKSTQ
jgi:hypothetical protein